MHRFFVDKNNISENEILIDNDDVKHIKNALRLEEDDEVMICDQEGMDYHCKITSIDKKEVVLNIISKSKSKSESDVEIVLYQGLPKSAKMELITQKTTELGVSKIVPVVTKRTVVKISDVKKENKKVERWNKIAKEASKQSKRGVVPKVEGILSFKELLSSIEGDIIVPYEDEDGKGIKEALSNIKESKKVNIIIGPEGGFEQEEIEMLKDIKAQIVSLGPRILRTETAGVVSVGLVQYELGDLGVI